MSSYKSHKIGDDCFIMSAERALFWENEATLIIADLHAGKTGHFRREGIGIPQQVYQDDLHRLLSQVMFFKASRLIIVGDLTHSRENKELDLFRKWRLDFPDLVVHLVKGNHDVLEEAWYREAAIQTETPHHTVKNALFVHDLFGEEAQVKKGQYIFSGHLHPGISISGRGKQSLHFPCFYFTRHFCVLPAFSRFTGTYKVRPKEGEHVFAIAGKEIIEL
jgi:DNA ligase-associated metallophosphoesterase